MNRRRFGYTLGGLTIATAIAWGSLGITVSAAQAPATISRAHDADFPPAIDEPVFMLILGGDARGTKGSEYGGVANPTAVRMDSIHIVAIDPVSKSASIVGIPRDSYVQIPGRSQTKINSAGTFGGPELTVRTVEELSGCRFDYYALTSFQGFTRIIDDLGGVTFDVDKALNDSKADIDVKAGTQTFDGATALGWARSRYSRPRGDFDRSLAQGDLMVAALTEARKLAEKDVGVPLRSLATLRRNLKLNIPVDEAFRLGLSMLRLDPENVTNIVVDGMNDSVNGSSVVRITDRGRSQLVDICDDGQLGS